MSLTYILERDGEDTLKDKGPRQIDMPPTYSKNHEWLFDIRGHKHILM